MGLLRDLRKEYRQYVGEHVKISISPIRPAVPGTVNPDEDFSFDLTVQNETVKTFAGAEITAGIPIVNVRIALYVSGGTGHLIVPALRNIKEVRSNESDPSSVLSSGQLAQHMVIFPVAGALAPGQELKLMGLKGKAGNAVGTIFLTCYAQAAIDMDWLFPKDPAGGGASVSIAVDVE
jgi:hypothetical protein